VRRTTSTGEGAGSATGAIGADAIGEPGMLLIGEPIIGELEIGVPSVGVPGELLDCRRSGSSPSLSRIT